jgi:hypothetical protein
MYEINVLVNGNKCKTYNHLGKCYIEAKNGSEYVIEIKNGYYGRKLVVASVDGINVMDGNVASENGPGYIIQSYSSLKIKGYRYSDSEVAAFKFVNKPDSYANTLNCGVIGIKIYLEYQPPYNLFNPYDYYPNPFIQPNKITLTDDETPYYKVTWGSTTNINCCVDSNINCSSGNNIGNSPTFDMGSTWGKKLESKVTEVEFSRGIFSYGLDIFYASRESLMNAGILLENANQVSFPQSFPEKYAKPPKNWKG